MEAIAYGYRVLKVRWLSHRLPLPSVAATVASAVGPLLDHRHTGENQTLRSVTAHVIGSMC